MSSIQRSHAFLRRIVRIAMYDFPFDVIRRSQSDREHPHAASRLPWLRSFCTFCQSLFFNPQIMTAQAERTSARMVPCSACLWLRRNLASTPRSEG